MTTNEEKKKHTPADEWEGEGNKFGLPNWEKKFDEKFPAMGVSDSASNAIYRHDSYRGDKSELKSFIRSLLQAERERGQRETAKQMSGYDNGYNDGLAAGRTEASREEVTRLEGWLDDGRALGDIIKERLNYLKKG